MYNSKVCALILHRVEKELKKKKKKGKKKIGPKSLARKENINRK